MRYDMVVIGAGPAGEKAATQAADFRQARGGRRPPRGARRLGGRQRRHPHQDPARDRALPDRVPAARGVRRRPGAHAGGRAGRHRVAAVAPSGDSVRRRRGLRRPRAGVRGDRHAGGARLWHGGGGTVRRRPAGAPGRRGGAGARQGAVRRRLGGQHRGAGAGRGGRAGRPARQDRGRRALPDQRRVALRRRRRDRAAGAGFGGCRTGQRGRLPRLRNSIQADGGPAAALRRLPDPRGRHGRRDRAAGRRAGPRLRGRQAWLADNARSRIAGTAGLVKLVFDRRLLGVHILSEEAGELVHLGQAVMHAGGTIDQFIHTTFNVPTRTEAYKYAAYDGLQRLAR